MSPTMQLSPGLPAVITPDAMAACFEVADRAFDAVAVIRLPEMWLEYLNAAGRQLLKVGPATPVSDLLLPDFVSSEMLPALLYEAAPAAAAGKVWAGSGVLRVKTGAEIAVRVVVAGIGGSDTPCEFALVAVTDRSTTRDLQSSLLHERMLLNAILDTLPDSIYFKDRDSRFISVNAAMARRTGGRAPKDLVGRSDFDYFTQDHAQKAFDDEQRIIETAESLIDVEEKESWPDGRITWVRSSKLPLRDERGRIIGTFGVSRDITAHKQAEEERRQMEVQLGLAQKMESIGRLAAGIAHEVNTPTQFVNDNTHFLQTAFQQFGRVLHAFRDLREVAARHPECAAAVEASRAAEESEEIDYLLGEVPRTLEQSLDGISRIARIVRSLKEFSHPGAPEMRPANLNHAIETALTVSRHEWKYVAEAVAELDPDLPSVPCVVDEFNQVILNLIVNAAHAIEDVVGDSGEKGRIVIRSRLDGEFACIDVQDTGTGIPPEIQSRIFEPFFTTKEQGKGTGQGLAIVHSVIVVKHRGAIAVTTAPGQGTTFHLRLPVHAPATPPSAE